MCWYSGETFMSFDEAVSILRQELNYPEDRALHFVKRFDHNKDGRLSTAEFTQFKSKIAEACVMLHYVLPVTLLTADRLSKFFQRQT